MTTTVTAKRPPGVDQAVGLSNGQAAQLILVGAAIVALAEISLAVMVTQMDLFNRLLARRRAAAPS